MSSIFSTKPAYDVWDDKPRVRTVEGRKAVKAVQSRRAKDERKAKEDSEASRYIKLAAKLVAIADAHKFITSNPERKARATASIIIFELEESGASLTKADLAIARKILNATGRFAARWDMPAITDKGHILLQAALIDAISYVKRYIAPVQADLFGGA